jgi:hypothetical protein
MQSEEMRLDGNAVAGVLRELFAVDATAADATCGGCGKVAPVGALFEYGQEMGVVLRCSTCGIAVLRLVRTNTATYVDFSGLRLLRIPQ